MLFHRLRRWPNIKQALVWRLLLAYSCAGMPGTPVLSEMWTTAPSDCGAMCWISRPRPRQWPATRPGNGLSPDRHGANKQCLTPGPPRYHGSRAAPRVQVRAATRIPASRGSHKTNAEIARVFAAWFLLRNARPVSRRAFHSRAAGWPLHPGEHKTFV